MLKVIYPVTSDIARKKAAWQRLHQICNLFGFTAHRPKLREEVFETEILFCNVDNGKPMTERQRMYTFTFHVDLDDRDKLIAKLCNKRQKLARLLTLHTMLLCIDDDLSVRPIHP